MDVRAVARRERGGGLAAGTPGGIRAGPRAPERLFACGAALELSRNGGRALVCLLVVVRRERSARALRMEHVSPEGHRGPPSRRYGGCAHASDVSVPGGALLRGTQWEGDPE